MKFEEFIHKGVAPNGSIKRGGAVRTKGAIIIGLGKGCGLSGCHCSDGFYISLVMPRNKKGEVRGIKVKFEDVKEIERIMREAKL